MHFYKTMDDKISIGVLLRQLGYLHKNGRQSEIQEIIDSWAAPRELEVNGEIYVSLSRALNDKMVTRYRARKLASDPAHSIVTDRGLTMMRQSSFYGRIGRPKAAT